MNSKILSSILYLTQYILSENALYVCRRDFFIYITCLLSKINDTVNNKRGHQRKRSDEDVRKPVKRRRTASSSKRAENNQFEPIEESCMYANDEDHDQYKDNKDNRATITERRKSTSSQEDESRMEKQEAGTSIDDDRKNVERKNAADDDDDDDDDDEKFDEASVEHNTNGPIREMDA